jgi:hypothetical protein
LTSTQLATLVTTSFTRPRRAIRQNHSTQLTVRLANDKKTENDCYKLRYLSYFSEGHIEPRRSEKFSDEYDSQPGVQTVVIYKGARAVASTRICLLTRWLDGRASGSLPAQHVFPQEIEGLFGRDAAAPVQRIVEINRLVRHPEFAEDRSLVFLLFRLAGHFILKHNAGAVVSCVRRNHVPFYTRLRFSEVAGPRTYHGVKFSTYLLTCLREQYDAVRRMVPVLDVSDAERERYDRLSQGQTVTVLP